MLEDIGRNPKPYMRCIVCGGSGEYRCAPCLACRLDTPEAALAHEPESPKAREGEAVNATPMSISEVMQRVSDHCNKHDGKTQAPFSIKGMRLLLAEIQHLRGVVKERPTQEATPASPKVSEALDEALTALRAVNKIVSDGAMTGFNWKDGDWPDRLFASQQGTSRAIRTLAALQAAPGAGKEG